MAVIPKTMKAVLTTGNGDYDTLSYCDVPTPVPVAGEILVQIRAAGINNTDINTRTGWYSASIKTGTDSQAKQSGQNTATLTDGGWNNSTPFPLIQGTDCCGIAVQTGPEGDQTIIGQRILVRSCMPASGVRSPETKWFGSDLNGAFAQFATVPVSEVYPVNSDWTDAELASIPCAYGTAENMLHRANLSEGDCLLVTGASGGVGSAVVQLAKRRRAKVFAVTSSDKRKMISDLGADRVFDRTDDLLNILGKDCLDVIVDNVVGDGFPALMDLLKRGGRYASSGAIGGPMATFDIRTVYLKDITLFGCTAWDPCIFPNLVRYIESDQIKPVLSKTFPLLEIEKAQRLFLEKKHVGKFVLIPPAPTG